jgi:hypothetical protein
MSFEYKVIPAPTRGKKARGVKTPADRFARALSEAINAEAEQGWEYLRTDTLPAEERQGLTGRTTVFQNMLVFRREAGAEATDSSPKVAVDSAADDAVNAPKLPSAEAAQAVPEIVEELAPDNTDSSTRRDVAAE